MKNVNRLKNGILFASVALTAGSANAIEYSWQGGSGAFSDANWTNVTANLTNQTHPSFGAPTIGDASVYESGC